MDTYQTTVPRIVETTPGDGTLFELHERYANKWTHTIHGVMLGPDDFPLLPFVELLVADAVIVNNYDLMLPRVRAALDVILSHCDGDVILLVQPVADVVQPMDTETKTPGSGPLFPSRVSWMCQLSGLVR